MMRPSEIADGDDLFSPFVAAGWSIATEANFRPAQWLGMLKILGVWGAPDSPPQTSHLRLRIPALSTIAVKTDTSPVM